MERSRSILKTKLCNMPYTEMNSGHNWCSVLQIVSNIHRYEGNLKVFSFTETCKGRLELNEAIE